MTNIYYDSSILEYKRLSYSDSGDVNQTNGSKNNSSKNVFEQAQQTTQENSIDLSEIDINTLVKKYKNNPYDVINELGINFTNEQKNELKNILKNKKNLKTFLKLIKENNALNNEDIMSAMKNIKNYKPAKNLLKRTGNFFKTLFKEGISDAIDIAKSETGHYAKKLGRNMNEIRKERSDFESETVADIGDTVTKEPKIKDNVMHFVRKSNKDGTKLYTEKDVIKARNIIVENIKDADEYTSDIVELEAIKDNHGLVKYKGSTIIDVGEKMIKNKDVKSTMHNVAKKSDMTDDALKKISSNVAQNHEIAEVIDSITKAKDKNGKNRFTATDVEKASNQLVTNNKSTCKEKTSAIKDLLKNKNLSAEEILNVTKKDSKSSNINNSQVSKTTDDTTLAAQKKSVENTTNTYNATDSEISNFQEQTNTPKTVSIPIHKKKETNNSTSNILDIGQNIANSTNSQVNDTQYTSKAVINGTTYERKEVLYELRKKFGTEAEKVLNKIEEDSSFIDVMKQYNGNKTIVAALVEDPHIITKIKKTTGSISINELADVLQVCTDNSSTAVMLEALQYMSVPEAITLTKKAKIFNLKDNAIELLTSNKRKVNKKQQINELLLDGAQKNNYFG